MPKQRSTRPDRDWKIPGVRMSRLAPPVPKPACFLLRVHLTDGPYDRGRYPDVLWRDILIGAQDTLEDLHAAIYEAFEREDEHLYEFNLGMGPRDRAARYLPAAEQEWGDDFASKDTDVPLSTLGLQGGRRFGYWFDFGDDWRHVIEVREVYEQNPKGKLPRIVERQGASPPQYPEGDE
jgi:hypothetical protein